jgi:SAM-dependent methyltransferase
VNRQVPAERPLDGVASRAGLRVLRIESVDAAAPAIPLPLDHAGFDLVVIRQTLQLVADRGRTLSQLRRALVPGGRVMVDVWGRLEGNPGYAALARSLERVAGVRVAAAVHWLFSLSEPEDVRAILAVAGFDDIVVRRTDPMARFPSVTGFLHGCVASFPVGTATSHLSRAEWERIVKDLESELSSWTGRRGLALPTEVIEAAATR